MPGATAVRSFALYDVLGMRHRRRIYTEENAKVVVAVWGTEFILFLAELAFLHQDDPKERMNCTRMI